jgi:hypothetical protein
MSSLLQAATGYESLLRVNDPKLPFRFDQIFQGGEGFFARRLAKQRFQLLSRLEGDIGRMLEPGERVEYVSWATEYSALEAYFMGLWHYLLNRRAVLLTDRRILLLQIDSRRRLRELKFQIRYEAIRGFSRRTLGYLSLELRNGQKVALTGLPRADRKAIRARIEERLRDGTKIQAHAHGAGKQNLCPHCFRSVHGLPERCANCAGTFKSGARAGWLSLALPGLGDLYLGHHALGVLEVLGALLLWGILLSNSLGHSLGGAETAAAAAATPAPLAAVALGVGAVFVTVHGVDSWITRRTGLKGLYPASKGIHTTRSPER